jgi:hypothetical protein
MVRPLTVGEVCNMSGCSFVLYRDIDKVKNIEDILTKGKCLILYQYEYDGDKVGHFVCLTMDRKGGLNYFDSTGGPPDEPLKWNTNPNDFTYINQLLYDYAIKTGKSIDYDDAKLQKINTNTCGYWAGVRMIYKDLTNEEFNACFRGVKDKDDLIVKLYYSF